MLKQISKFDPERYGLQLSESYLEICLSIGKPEKFAFEERHDFCLQWKLAKIWLKSLEMRNLPSCTFLLLAQKRKKKFT